MVTGYDIISGRWSSHFWVKMHVLSTFFNNKSKTCEWNDAEGLFMCYFTCEAQNITIYLILGKIQDGGQGGDHCWWRHRPPAASPPIKYTSSCWVDQSRSPSRLSTEGKIVSKYCNISKTLWRGSIPIPPPAPCTTVGVWICVYVQGLTLLN